MKKSVFISAIALAGLIGCGGSGADGKKGSTENNTTIPTTGIYLDSDSDKVKYLKVINYARSIARECKNNDGSSTDASEGSFAKAAALTLNEDLYNSAFEHSKDMAESDIFSHLGSGTANDTTGSNIAAGHQSTFIERIEANGYTGYTTIGENISAGQTSIEESIHGLLESPKHCANIMNSSFKEVGMALYSDNSSTYKHYWTQNFGAK